jgi:hypothetical protein
MRGAELLGPGSKARHGARGRAVVRTRGAEIGEANLGRRKVEGGGWKW